MADYKGLTAEIGGIGASRIVPILNVDRLSVPTREGATLVWENVDILVADVAGLDGIFGMNLLVPAITSDPADPLGSLLDRSPGAFSAIVIDTTDARDPVLRFSTHAAEGTLFAWLGQHFSAAERLVPETGGLAGDADGDGLANLVEYALGLDPRSPSLAAERPAAGWSGEAGDFYPTFTFTRPVGLRDVVHGVEISDDLVNWRRGGEELAPATSLVIDGRETRTYRTLQPLTPGSRRFFRLAVSLLP